MLKTQAADETRPRPSLPMIAEVLGHVGTAVAITACLLLLTKLWPSMPPGVILPFTAIVAAGLITAGAVLRAGEDPALSRLRSVFWLVATASIATFVSAGASQVLHVSVVSTGLLGAAGWTAGALPLWWRHRTALLHLSLYAGTVTLAAFVAGQVDSQLPIAWLGVVIWLASVLWGLAAWRGYLMPVTAGLVAGSVGALIGAIVGSQTDVGRVLGLLTVAGLLAAGIAAHRALLIGFGAVGMLYVIPDTAGHYLPGSIAPLLAVILVGLALLAIALWIARSRRLSSTMN
jgi:hypothetical protein